MLIIGIDPGLTKTGWGVLRKDGQKIKFVAKGEIASKSDEDIGNRLFKIFAKIDELIKHYKIEQFAIEDSFVNKNAVSSLKLAKARAAAMIAASKNNLEINSYASNHVKKSVSSFGHASKNQMTDMIKYFFQIDANKDEADAIAVAFCHALHIDSNLAMLEKKRAK